MKSNEVYALSEAVSPAQRMANEVILSRWLKSGIKLSQQEQQAWINDSIKPDAVTKAAQAPKRTAAPAPQYSKDEYIALLKKHDWTYQRSEDPMAYRAGKAAEAKINAMKKQLDPDGTLYDQYAEGLTEYDRPDSFPHKMIDKTTNRAMGYKNSTWANIKDFFSGNWTTALEGNTKFGFAELKKLGLDNNQINEFRAMLHKVLGGMYKSKGYTVVDRKYSKADRASDDIARDNNDYKNMKWANQMHKTSQNFTGWSGPIGSALSEKEILQVRNQVVANLKKKFPEISGNK